VEKDHPARAPKARLQEGSRHRNPVFHSLRSAGLVSLPAIGTLQLFLKALPKSPLDFPRTVEEFARQANSRRRGEALHSQTINRLDETMRQNAARPAGVGSGRGRALDDLRGAAAVQGLS